MMSGGRRRRGIARRIAGFQHGKSEEKATVGVCFSQPTAISRRELGGLYAGNAKYTRQTRRLLGQGCAGSKAKRCGLQLVPENII